jgi:hypothetical protein
LALKERGLVNGAKAMRVLRRELRPHMQTDVASLSRNDIVTGIGVEPLIASRRYRVISRSRRSKSRAMTCKLRIELDHPALDHVLDLGDRHAQLPGVGRRPAKRDWKT